MLDPAKVLAELASREQESLNLLGELVSINSFTSNVEGVSQVQRKLVEIFRPLGFEPELRSSPGAADHLILRNRLAREGAKAIILVGHADTVHPPGSLPHELRVENGMAHGPGAADMKGGIVTIYEALRICHAAGIGDRLPLAIYSDSQEELGGEAAAAIIAALASEGRCALVFEPGQPGDGIILNRKARAIYSVLAEGLEAHAGSARANGINAIELLCAFLTNAAELHGSLPGGVYNVGKIAGGSAVNTVAGRACADLELRADTLPDLLELEKRLTSCSPELPEGSSITLSRLRLVPPMSESKEARELYESYARFSGQAGLGSGIAPTVGGMSDGNLFSAAGLACLDGLGPEGFGTHSARERLRIASIRSKAANLALWLDSLADADPAVDTRNSTPGPSIP